MQSFTSGSSWECAEWFQTFSGQFPQYTSPGIRIAAQERLHGLKQKRLTWDATSRTVRLSLTNSRGKPYTLALHFYPAASPSLTKILAEAAKTPGLIPCLAAGDLPPALGDAVRASGEDVFLRTKGAVEFDPGMMASECALLIAAFIEELETEPGRWFRFIGLDFAKGAEKMLMGGRDAAAPEGDAAESAEARDDRPDPVRQLDEPLSGAFEYADFTEVIENQASGIRPLGLPEMDLEGAVQRLRLWSPGLCAPLGTTLVDALPATGLSVVEAKRSWCAFGDPDAREFLQTVVRAAAHAAKESVSALARRELRQEKNPAVTANPKWTKFFEKEVDARLRDPVPGLGLKAGVTKRLRSAVTFIVPDPVNPAAEPARVPVDFDNFLAAVLALTRRELLAYPPVFALWHALALTAAELVAAGAVMPVPVPLILTNQSGAEADGFRVFWVPTLHVPDAARMVSEALAVMTEPFAALAADPPAGCLTFTEAAGPKSTPQSAVFAALTLLTTSLVRSAADKNREVSRRLIGRRVRNVLTGEGFAPDAPALPDLSNVLAAFLGLPLAAATLPCRIRITGALEKGALRLTLGLIPRAGAADSKSADGTETLLTLPEWEALGLDPERRVRAALRILAATHPLFSEFGRDHAEPAWLPRSQWEFFLFSAVPALSAFGFDFNLPDSMKRIEKPKLVLSAEMKNAAPKRGARLATQGMLNAAALADFKWEIAVGDERLSLEELRERINNEGELLTSGGVFFHLTREDYNRLIEEWMDAHKRALTNWEKLRALLSGEIAGRTVEATEELLARIRQSAAVKELEPPRGLNAVLRPYQIRGYSWLVQNSLLGLGSLLADDMGLGKTVQVIAAIVELKNRGVLNEGKVLIAAPASLLVNWEREIERFAPGLTTKIFHGKERDLGDGQERPDILITSYGLLKRELVRLTAMPFKLFVLDEAQAVKNSKTGQARAAQDFPAESVVALTGTPVENRLSEYWSIFSIIEPGLLGTPAQFRREFVDPIEERRDRGAIDRFRQITAPFLLRRVKTDPGILDELPEKNVVDYFTTLTPKQIALYEACLKENLETLETLDADAAAYDEAGRTANASQLRMSRRGQILRMILHLKQISNSPSQFLKEDAEKPDSGKAEALMELLHRCRQAGRKALIFTQFREMGERLVKWIEAASGRRPEFLHGGVPASKRMEMVDAFQNDPEAEVFVLSLKAGGTGLNLTAASAVIHYDLWWNPAVEDQASDRAWRIGQRRDVVVYRFITAGTFEEKVNEMLKKKRELADLAVGVGESWICDLTDEEIKSIFTLSKH